MAAEPQEEWVKVNLDFPSTFAARKNPSLPTAPLPPQKYPGHKNPASYAG